MNPFNMKTNETSILAYREGILEQFKLRQAGPRVIIYADYVETPLARKWQVSKVITGNRSQGALLVAIDGSFGGLDVVSGARLDFHKAKHILVPAYEVDFAPRMRRAEVAGDHQISVAPEIEVGILLTALPGALVLGARIGRQGMVRKPVKGTNGGVSEAAGGHAQNRIVRDPIIRL